MVKECKTCEECRFCELEMWDKENISTKIICHNTNSPMYTETIQKTDIACAVSKRKKTNAI